MKAPRGLTHLVIYLMIAAVFCASARAQEEPKFEFPADHPLITQAFEALDQDRYVKSARLFVAAINESRTERWSLYYLARNGQAAKENLAFLIDRVLIAEGKPQVYGTQFRYQDGKTVLAPVKDEASLDHRRRRMGLASIDAYRKQMQSK